MTKPTNKAKALTPARAAATMDDAGCGVLASSNLKYADGSEAALATLLAGARDRGSLSDELERAAATWAERYHLSKARGNVLRALELPSDAVVLEVGAGCGAVTRYLGERVALVDALEPMPDRARVARLRTADLEHVAVLIGGLEDVPVEPTYDVIVVIGVLEHMGRGSSDLALYSTWLASARALLLPGGVIVCAIENQLGVKYFCGAREDHTDLIFDGVEGYPRPGPARTFSRAALSTIFDAAGLTPRFLHAFPDYKLPRVVFDDTLLKEHAELAIRLPAMPSPDWQHPRPRLAHEGLVWRSLVDAGVAEHFSNSYVIIGDSAAPRVDLWPPDIRARLFSTDRSSAFAVATTIRDEHGRLLFERKRIAGHARSATNGSLSLAVADSLYEAGARDFVDAASAASDSELQRLLAAWLHLLSSQENLSEAVDLVPRNLLVRDGALIVIDQEWQDSTYTFDDIARRGLLQLAIDLADWTVSDRWVDSDTTAGLLGHLASLANYDAGNAWMDDTVAREARLQALVRGLTEHDLAFEEAVQRTREDLWTQLSRPLRLGPLGDRADVQLERLNEELTRRSAPFVLRTRHAIAGHLRRLKSRFRGIGSSPER